MDFGVYVHVPFCRRQCPYCTFFTLPRPNADREMTPFLDAVWREWRLRVTPRLERGDRLRTLYLGGGTPSDLPLAPLGEFLRRVAAPLRGGLGALDEVTVECNPESAGGEFLDELRAHGVGRISLGVQALDAEDLHTLGRTATPRQIRAALDAVAARFSTWNADLILGVPGSSERRLLDALSEFGHRGVPHLSLYCLELPRERALALGDAQDARSEAAKADLYARASAWLQDHGYDHYEISNAALPGHAARHNTAYWEGRDYVGLGPGAHSFAAGVRRSNRADLDAYVAALAAWTAPPAHNERLTPAQRWRERVLLGLRTSRGVDIAALGLLDQRPWIEELCDRGLARLQGHRLRLLPAGWLVADSIVLQLVTAREESAGRVDNAIAPSLHWV